MGKGLSCCRRASFLFLNGSWPTDSDFIRFEGGEQGWIGGLVGVEGDGEVAHDISDIIKKMKNSLGEKGELGEEELIIVSLC